MLHFEIAAEKHDAVIRRLLKSTPLEGDIKISLEREPSYFHGAKLLSQESRTLLAFCGTEPICMGSCGIQERFLNGKPCRMGYLGELRLQKRFQGRFDVLRRGYSHFAKTHELLPLDYYFTSISANNERSVRFLEKGLRGMPKYERLQKLKTLFIRVPVGYKIEDSSEGAGIIQCSQEHVSALVSFLNLYGARCQLAKVWTETELLKERGEGLTHKNYFLAQCKEGIIGCAFLWDQRKFKQLVVQGYSPRLRLIKPFYNLASIFTGAPRFPKIGHSISFGAVSLFSSAAMDLSSQTRLLESILAAAALSHLDHVALCLTEGDRLVNILRQRFAVREYDSILYSVRWPGMEVIRLDGRPFHLDVAFL
jgi:hypothetical protein